MTQPKGVAHTGPMSSKPKPPSTPPGSEPELSMSSFGWVPSVGEIFAGTYRVQRNLGEGAMGVVLLGRDVRLERDVAIKLIHPDYVASPEAHQRFLEEARAMARVRHENVVEIYAFDEYRSSPYFIMEYVPGMHVEAWMEQRKGSPVAIDEAIGIIDQVCRGVSAIHKAGAVHRDLKWTNVLIGPAFRVCVADLGLARILDKPRKEARDTVSGTPAYMAPESVTGAVVPPGMHGRADVYSLAVMAYELLTGRLPYETDDAIEMMTAHVDGTPPTPSEIRADLPPAFDRVLLKAMAKDPTQRTASADAFRRELLSARQSVSAGSRGLRFIVADDDEDFASLVSETLSFAFPGADVVKVDNGASALGAVEQRAASLAVIDLDMPGLNGIELTAAFRATPNAEKMPILVATATGGAPDWRLLQALGADGFVVKPIDPMALVALVRRTLGQK
ncbi:MAG: protein kinase [Deltaproteobacteria bacterium]|nr:protein kinase [Deltaproteobacteria bacterium]